MQNKELPKWCECTYCGIGANAVDHVVPVSYNKNKRKKNKKALDKSKTVPCCHQCNSILSNVACHTIHERAEHVAIRLSQKYEKLLNSPYWSDEEIEELDNYIQSKVIGEQARKQIILNRIRWARAVSAMEFLDNKTVWAAVNKGDPLLKFLGYN